MGRTMRVTVEYYAAAKSLVGVSHDSFDDLEDGIEIDSFLRTIVCRHPVLGPHLSKLRVALNDSFVSSTSVALSDGDVVGLLPPLAGGSSAIGICEITSETPSIDRVFQSVAHAGAGGVVVFVGVIRERNDGHAVETLEYDAHPRMAERELRAVLEGVVRDHAEARVAASHRVGRLRVGEVAVVVAASAPHRAEAFEACRAAIDRLKERVPIWKHELGPDGDNWVGW